MIPSRGIARSIPSGISSGLSASRLSSRTFATRSIPSVRNAAILTGHGTRARLFPTGASVAPVTLGSVAASRNLSLWGWGSSVGHDGKLSAQATAEAAAQEQQHAASSATDAATDNVAAPPSLTEPTANMDLSEFGGSDGRTASDILDLSSNELGYLKELGLDFGIGPTSGMQYVLEHIHISTGMGWGASIILSAFALRAAMIVPHIMQLRNGARMARMQADPRAEDMKRLTTEATALGLNGGMEKRQQASVIAKRLKAEYGVRNIHLMWMLVQFPFTFGLFKLVRHMANLPVPGMETAGFAWFVDLTVRDPYFLLPALATGTMILSIQVGKKYMAEAQRKMMQPMIIALSTIGLLVTSFLSAGVNLMGVAFATATLSTSLVLEIPALRRSLGLLMGPPPAPATAAKTAASLTAADLSNVPKGIRYEAPRGASAPAPEPTTAEEVTKPLSMSERLKTSYEDARQGMSQQLGSFGGRFAASEAEKAERNRKELIKKLEEKRQQQERDEFNRKYKR